MKGQVITKLLPHGFPWLILVNFHDYKVNDENLFTCHVCLKGLKLTS